MKLYSLYIMKYTRKIKCFIGTSNYKIYNNLKMFILKYVK